MAVGRFRKVQRAAGSFIKTNRFDHGEATLLPEAYKKFWREWKVMKPAAVHYIPEEGRWKRNIVTGEVLPIQNVPIPIKYPKEADWGLWGGEGVIKGFQKRHEYNRRVPHFWIPSLKRSVVRSEVLDVYLSIIVTERTIKLIHDNYGFDHYLLKTPACDLRSVLALKLKRKILLALFDKCPAYKDTPDQQTTIYEEYKNYLSAYTPEEIEWYGLTWGQAIQKIHWQQQVVNAPKPLKQKYRSQLIEQLKIHGIAEAQDGSPEQMPGHSWISKMNPFGKKHET
ncbi:mitochondrial ribosomal protein L28 [Arctopsyche grandis]|uniref:mitochondrial ribosomal protein L28 n=1 Tax=Arctopsyche grandis TaxID=121162 RepID=UPI00406D718C